MPEDVRFLQKATGSIFLDWGNLHVESVHELVFFDMNIYVCPVENKA